MKSVNKFAIAFVALVASAMNARAAEQLVAPSPDPMVLKRVVKRFFVKDATVPQCIFLLADHLIFRCALEDVTNNEQAAFDTKISLDLKDVTFEQILEALGKKCPQLQWQINRYGALWVHPLEADEYKVLNLRLDNYVIKKSDFSHAYMELENEIKKKVPDFGMFDPVRPWDMDNTGRQVLVNAERHNVTVRDVLDLLAAKYETSWDMSEVEGKGLRVRLWGPFLYISSTVDGMISKSAIVEPAENICKAMPRWYDGGGYAGPLGLYSPLQQLIAHVHIENATIPESYQLLSRAVHFNYVLEKIPVTAPPESHRHNLPVERLDDRVTTDFENVSLDDVIGDIVVKQAFAYTPDERENVLEVYGKNSDVDKAYPLLHKLPEYSAVGVGLPSAVDTLAQLLTANSPNGAKFISVVKKEAPDGQGDPIVFNIDMKDVTGRDALAEVARRSGLSFSVIPATEDKTYWICLASDLVIAPDVLQNSKITDTPPPTVSSCN